jgi:Ca2+-transporting ATPase
MKRSPRDPKEPLVTRNLAWLIGWQGFLISASTLLAYSFGMTWYGTEGNVLARANTIAFLTLALSQIFHAFSARSKSRSAFTDKFFSNNWLLSAVALCVLL